MKMQETVFTTFINLAGRRIVVSQHIGYPWNCYYAFAEFMAVQKQQSVYMLLVVY